MNIPECFYKTFHQAQNNVILHKIEKTQNYLIL